ncbi:MAG: hypothetical protein JKX84_10250 [Flavobacteriales bacterium]|nr:hypothetical protein [Flavobacteriales bacterium]
MNYKTLFFVSVLLVGISSCKPKEGCTDPMAINYDPAIDKDDGSCVYEATGPNLIFKFKFDSTRLRCDSFGQPATIPAGNAAQHAKFNSMSAHYVEMITNAQTWLGAGQIIYQGKETTAGGDNAVDFSKSNIAAENEVFLSVPISEIAAGTYEYIRVSVGYQNFDITFNALGFNGLTGTLASFVGFNTYIENYTVDQQTVTVNSNKLQGYWAFETQGNITEGQAPVGATTVVNPLFASSPVPAGSCIVTGEFATPLTLTGNETEDVVVVLSVSTNNSFEWTDPDGNGQYDPLNGDVPVDMGLRGMKAIVQ